MQNIMVGMCSGGTVCAETVTSLIGAMETLRDKGVGVSVSMQVGGYKPHNCNKLVSEAQQQGATHIMFIDADMIFPSSGIIRLLDHDKDIAGANYNQRGNPMAGDPKTSTIKLADEQGNLIASNEIPPQLFKCWSLGLGFALIKMAVFEKLEKPYFRDAESPEGEHRTEDVEFFTKCQKAGFEVWCNPTINMGHIGKAVY